MERGDLLTAFEGATSADEAFAAVDAMAAEKITGIGSHYDAVADLFANEDRYAEAADAQRKALDFGYDGVPDGREMLAWYLIKAGDEEGDQLWRTLLGERPDEPDVHLTAGVAHLDADRPGEAADLLGRSIELTLRGAVDADGLREAVAERAVALEEAGRSREAVDEHAAATLERLERQVAGAPIAVPWYPQEEFARAIAELPGFAADWGEQTWEEYSRELDGRMREVGGVHGHRPILVPVRVDDLLAFAAQSGLDADAAEVRARYADDHRDEALAWPPSRNDRCWCGVDAKYKRHCGA